MRKKWLWSLLAIGAMLAVAGVLLWTQARPQPQPSAQADNGACAAFSLQDQDLVEANTYERLLNQLENKQGLTLTIPDIQALQPLELTLPAPTQAGTCAP